MDSDDELESDCESDEAENAETKAQEGLRRGTLKVENSDGTFRCPFSPSRKKQDYKYSEIFQHAAGVSKGKRGREAAGNHRALLTYLKENLAARAQPQAERNLHLEQSVPARIDRNDKLVCPWMGILVNIDNNDRRKGDNFRIGPGGADIKEKFMAFNPESVKVFYDSRGHLGVAVIGFRNTMDGFKDAEAFDHSFDAKHCHRKDFKRDSRDKKMGLHLYGWQASKRDVEDPSVIPTIVCDHLKTNGDLKSLSQMVREMERKAEQQVTNIKGVVDLKENTIKETHKQAVGWRNLFETVEVERRRAENEKEQLVETHKREVEALQIAARIAGDAHTSYMLSHRQRLEMKLRALESRCSTLQETEIAMKMKNEAERERLEAGRKEAEQELEKYRGQAKKQEEQQKHQLELIKKHEEESKRFETEMQQQRMKLESKHRRELESHRVTEQLEAEKAQEADILEGKGQESEEESRKRIQELEEKMKDLEEEAEGDRDLLNVLTYKHREANDELEDAKTRLRPVLEEYGNDEKIGLKLLGSLNTVNWEKTIGHKFKSDEEYANYVSSLDARIRKNDFEPTKTINLGNGKFKIEINQDDEVLTELLTTLRKDYGPLICESVVQCILEIEKWNPSGRYITAMPWNFAADRKATMTEVIDHLELVITAKEKDLKAKKLELKAMERDLKAKELECKAIMKDLRAKDVDSTSKVKAGSGVKAKRKRGQS